MTLIGRWAAETILMAAISWKQWRKHLNRQIITSTHSSDLLRDEGIGLDEVLLLQPGENGTSVRPAKDFDEIHQLLNGGLSLAEAVLPVTRLKMQNSCLCSDNMCFRIAVREVEAWLLADRQCFASFFQIPLSTIPTDPESIDNPKELVVSLAGRSRSRAIKDDMVPRPGSGRSVGPGYISRLIEFAFDLRKGWRPQQAACSSDSLKRCLNCLHEFAERAP